jgi:NAD(P)-dependent dehydrogenase (short-subunit alcohol dehydrogenase family)
MPSSKDAPTSARRNHKSTESCFTPPYYDVIGAVLGLSPVEDRDDVRVDEGRGALGFAPETLDKLFILGVAGLERLDRAVPVEDLIVSQVDVGHASAAGQGLKLVPIAEKGTSHTTDCIRRDLRYNIQAPNLEKDRVSTVGISGGADARPRTRDDPRYGGDRRPGQVTNLLLPRLLDSLPARIVNVASAGQSPVDFEDPLLVRDYDAMKAYSQSKLAQIMFTFELAERLPDEEVTVNALHPASLMDTKMVKETFGHSMSTIEEGAEATVRLTASPELEGLTGRYFDGMRETHADRPTTKRPEKCCGT